MLLADHPLKPAVLSATSRKMPCTHTSVTVSVSFSSALSYTSDCFSVNASPTESPFNSANFSLTSTPLPESCLTGSPSISSR